MSGPNEHHIPQFLQRSFGAPRRGKRPNEIWLYARDADPELRSISKTGSENYFYGSDLDAKLKGPESSLGQQYATLRKQPIGSAVDPPLASELMCHLAPRSKHLRAVMAAGFHQLGIGARRLFSDPDKLTTLLGLDASDPTAQFGKHLRDAIEGHPQLKAIGLPLPVLERVAFYLAREQSDINIGSAAAMIDTVLGHWSSEAPTMVRDGHNRALEKMSEGTNPRRDRLAGFSWSIESAPSEGAFLPDCVALGFAQDEPALPMMLIGKEIQCAVMPISTSKLLVGRAPRAPLPDLSDFNVDAAACCEEFFLGYSDTPAFRSLTDLIGSRTAAHFDDAIETAVSDLLPPRVATAGTVQLISAPRAAPHIGQSFGYDVVCLDFGDEEVSQRIADVIAPLVERLNKVLPLSRLDGITVAVDYYKALRTLDRGSDLFPNLAAEGPSEVGIIGATIPVVREGQAKGRVMLSVLTADYLLRDDEAAVGLALQTLGREPINGIPLAA